MIVGRTLSTIHRLPQVQRTWGTRPAEGLQVSRVEVLEGCEGGEEDHRFEI